jgi:hypothetical protein
MSVGYRNPPKSGQFKKGKSGNPKGRPKDPNRRVSPGYLFWKVANEQVPIEIGGSLTMMSRWEAFVRMVQTLALNKDAGAARLLYKMRKQFPGTAPSGDKYLSVTYDSDRYL